MITSVRDSIFVLQMPYFPQSFCRPLSRVHTKTGSGYLSLKLRNAKFELRYVLAKRLNPTDFIETE